MKNKTDYRIYAKEIRKKLNIKLLSSKLVSKVRQEAHYISAKHVMIYYPTKYEIDLRELLNDNKNFYLPKVSGNELLTCPYSDKLEKSQFSIMEPCSKPVNPQILDLVIVPALMADNKGYRLGYGGGFYDRFLPMCTNAFKLCVLPQELIIKSLPHEPFDVKLDKILYM